MGSAPLEKSTEPDGAASLPQKTIPAKPGVPGASYSFGREGEAPSEPWTPFSWRVEPCVRDIAIYPKIQDGSCIAGKFYGGRRRDTPYHRKRARLMPGILLRERFLWIGRVAVI